jgi:hypothetical protein
MGVANVLVWWAADFAAILANAVNPKLRVSLLLEF